MNLQPCERSPLLGAVAAPATIKKDVEVATWGLAHCWHTFKAAVSCSTLALIDSWYLISLILLC
jgi:hypothetical protein